MLKNAIVTSIVGFDGTDHMFLVCKECQKIIHQVIVEKISRGWRVLGVCCDKTHEVFFPKKFAPVRFVIGGVSYDPRQVALDFHAHGRKADCWNHPLIGVADCGDVFFVCPNCQRVFLGHVDISIRGSDQRLFAQFKCRHCIGRPWRKMYFKYNSIAWAINGRSDGFDLIIKNNEKAGDYVFHS